MNKKKKLKLSHAHKALLELLELRKELESEPRVNVLQLELCKQAIKFVELYLLEPRS